MLPRISRVRHIQDYRLELTFSNGVQAELDFETGSWDAASFEPLQVWLFPLRRLIRSSRWSGLTAWIWTGCFVRRLASRCRL
jgi:hypothetical protein